MRNVSLALSLAVAAPYFSELSCLGCVKLNLRTRQVECYEYGASDNPPVLHRKESFLRTDDPRHAKFARLTAQEEKFELLNDPSGIGTREGWARRLAERGFELRGHRLVRCNRERQRGGRIVESGEG
jgi:hypothetical protein